MRWEYFYCHCIFVELLHQRIFPHAKGVTSLVNSDRDVAYIYKHTTSGKYTNIAFLYKYTIIDQLPVTVKLHSHIEDCIIHVAAWMVLVLTLQR